MNILVNGEELDIPTGMTVRQLLEHLQLGNRPTAVERNGQIVPHATFDQATLADGDTLELVTLVGGG